MARVLFAVAAMFALSLRCSSAGPALVPVVEVPSRDSDAYPYGAIDTLELSVAHVGDPETIALVSAPIGETLTLDGVGFGSDLVVHLSGRSGGTELAYGRTCTFRLERGQEAAPLLYFSRIVRWASGPVLATPRRGAVIGISLKSSQKTLFWSANEGGIIDVLDSGGLGVGAAVGTLEGQLPAQRGATVTSFGDRILLIGGVNQNGDAVKRVEQILPGERTASNQVQQVVGPAIVGHQSIELQDGSVLVAGGTVQTMEGGAFVPSETAFVFSLLSGELVQREIRPGLAISRTGHSMTRLGGEVGADILIIGGMDSSGAGIAQAELYRPLRGAFENLDSALLATPRYNHKAVRLPGGFVLVVGGVRVDVNGIEVPVRELELYDPAQGVFRPAGRLPGSAGVTGMSVTQLPDGRFLLAGGEDIDGNKVSTALIARFDPIDGVVDLSPTAPLRVVRSNHAAVVLCDGTILITGGANMGTDTERYNPPSPGRR